MAQRDSIHNAVKQSLIKDGWVITDDPYVIAYGERFLFVDLGAEETGEAVSNFIGAHGPICELLWRLKSYGGNR